MTAVFLLELLSTNVACISGLDLKKIERCMGDPEADSDNPVLKEEQDAQVSIMNFCNSFEVYKKCHTFA